MPFQQRRIKGTLTVTVDYPIRPTVDGLSDKIFLKTALVTEEDRRQLV